MAYFPHTLGADDFVVGYSLTWSGSSGSGSAEYGPGANNESQAKADFDFQKSRKGALSVVLKRSDGTVIASFAAPAASSSTLTPMPVTKMGGGLTTAGMVAVGLGAVGLFYLVVR